MTVEFAPEPGRWLLLGSGILALLLLHRRSRQATGRTPG
jgi:hypothetical protein